MGERLWRIRDGLARFGDFLTEAWRRASAPAPISRRADLERWTSLLARLEENFARARGLNLEPRQTVLSAARDLAATPRGRARFDAADAMLVDSHCHLDFPDYAGKVDAVVARARAAGVGVCVSIGTELKRFPGVRAVAEQFRRCLVQRRRPSA